ncbi:MAG: AAA family ATPase [Polyangiaceae bacterium]
MFSRPFAESFPQDFYSDANGRIYAAITSLALAGHPVDVVTVAGHLRDHGRLKQAGGSPYLAQLADATPAVAHVAEHAERVARLARQREAVRRAHEFVAKGYDAVSDVHSWIGEFAEGLGALAKHSRSIPVVGVDHLFRPLPPVDYVLAALDICPGAPTLVAGAGFSAKTLAFQSLAISVAAGLPVWGCLAAKRGKVLHLDYEQGDRLTSERYQRLAAGLQLTPDDIGDRLQVATLPTMGLDDLCAEAEIRRLCQGVAVAIIDSFRAAFPHVDENSSEARLPLDMLGRVSQVTGCTFIVIHHARKPQMGAPGGVRASIRGTGALFDAAGSVIVMEADKGKPVKLIHEKARTSGHTADDMLLRIADVEIPGERVAGLTVHAESAPAYAPEKVTSDVEETVLAIIRSHPGDGARALRERSPVGNVKTDAALRRLLDSGRVVDRGAQSRGKPSAFYVEESDQ